MKMKRIFGGANMISLRLAVTVITLLFVFTLLGWVLTELFPSDFVINRARYAETWGKTATSMSIWLRLYDPFHSFWYIGMLGVFFCVLLLCVVSRAASLAGRAFGPRAMADPSGIPGRDPEFCLGWPAAFGKERARPDPLEHFGRKFGKHAEADIETRRMALARLLRILAKKGFRTWSGEHEGTMLFTAQAGGWRHVGTLLFHAGLLIITAGGMVGGIWGSMEILYGKAGDVIPLYGNRYSVRVDDFEIISSPTGEIRDYVSGLTVLDSLGNIEKNAKIEVNHPLNFKGFNIYQSTYRVGDDIFGRARIRYTPAEGHLPLDLVVRHGEKIALKDSLYVLIPGRFFPDFRLDASGPYSASNMMLNPALEIHLSTDDGVETGYILLRYPSFSSKFRELSSIILTDIEPVYYTGLEITRNPGAYPMLAGLFVASLGLLLMYLFNYRVVGGTVGAEGIRIWAIAGRWKEGLGAEIQRIGEKLKEELAEATVQYRRYDE